MKIIDGKLIADEILKDIRRKVDLIEGKNPGLAIILVGEREDSEIYVKLKEKRAKEVGIDTHIYKCASGVSEEEIIQMVDHLNKDDEIDAILVQLPLPEKMNTVKIIERIDLNKDVDRFHPENLKILQSTCSHDHVMPPVFAVVVRALEQIGYDLKDKKVCVIANSEIFGKNLARVLECLRAKVSTIDPDDVHLKEKTVEADVLITAAGKPEFIKGSMVKEGAVIIDIGITKEKNAVVGDVDFSSVIERCSYITPVPGGVGPMTVAMLLKNVVALAKKK